jgi:hypothetical protein
VKLRQFDAVQFRGKMERGLNRPFKAIGKLRDGGDRELLVVKSRAGYADRPEAILRELFSLLLARELGLKAPEPVLVNLQPGFEFGAADYPDSAALIRESFGWNLATVHLGEGWKQWMQGSLPRSISEQSIVGAYAFDAMVQNSDREVENPNLLWRGEELALLDFDRAFAFLRIEEIEPRPWRNTLISQNLNRHCLYPHLPNWKEGEIIAVPLWDSFNEWWIGYGNGQISEEIAVGFADPELDLPRLEEYLVKFSVATEDFFRYLTDASRS